MSGPIMYRGSMSGSDFFNPGGQYAMNTMVNMGQSHVEVVSYPPNAAHSTVQVKNPPPNCMIPQATGQYYANNRTPPPQTTQEYYKDPSPEERQRAGSGSRLGRALKNEARDIGKDALKEGFSAAINNPADIAGGATNCFNSLFCGCCSNDD